MYWEGELCGTCNKMYVFSLCLQMSMALAHERPNEWHETITTSLFQHISSHQLPTSPTTDHAWHGSTVLFASDTSMPYSHQLEALLHK